MKSFEKNNNIFLHNSIALSDFIISASPFNNNQKNLLVSDVDMQRLETEEVYDKKSFCVCICEWNFSIFF